MHKWITDKGIIYSCPHYDTGTEAKSPATQEGNKSTKDFVT